MILNITLRGHKDIQSKVLNVKLPSLDRKIFQTLTSTVSSFLLGCSY